jgi:hypothetical protein
LRLGRWGRLGAGALLGTALLAVFFKGVEWPALAAAFRSAHPGYLAGLVLATLLTYVARAWRWGFLLAPLAAVPLGRLFSVTVLGFMTGLAIPRAGEVVRPYLIGRRYGVATSAAFATIILERLFDLLTVVLLFGLYLYVLPAPAGQTRGPLIGLLKVGGAVAGLGALAITALLALFHARADRAHALVDRLLGFLPHALAGVLSRLARSFTEGLAVLQAPPAHLAAIAGQSLLTWLGIALTVHWTNLAFGIDLPFHAAFLIIGFLTVGVAVPTPGMVGGFHEAYKLALTQTYAIDAGPAVAAGIAMHALSNLPVLLLGLAFLGEEGLTFGKVAKMTEEETA